jgi:hypothetical protein
MPIFSERHKVLLRAAGKTIFFALISLATDPSWDQCWKNEVVADSCSCKEPNSNIDVTCYGCTNSTTLGESDEITCSATANSSCVCGYWLGRNLPIYFFGLTELLIHIYFRYSGRDYDPNDKVFEDIWNRNYSREAWLLYCNPCVCLITVFI